MRLLNIKIYKLESFDFWETVPPYAILSHRWEEEEVDYDDITKGSAETKRGWRKILGACEEASKLGIFYVWVDTCCIFKQSSAELSESINSMFAWYRDARICFAYMGDVGAGADDGAFDTSVWWTRGWTLQELIAPTEIMFFDQTWDFVDLRSSRAGRIAKITGIAEEILQGGNLDKLLDFSTAAIFSWAAKRETSRGEDRAYSLMGLFGVNMSMIYGEGEQAAFFRLQKEIFAVNADHSIFAWHYPQGDPLQTYKEKLSYDLLASCVSAFASSADIVSEPYNWDAIGRPKLDKVKTASASKPLAKYSASSHGIRVQMLLENQDNVHYVAYLACRHRANGGTLLQFVLVLDKRSGDYRRLSPHKLGEITVDSYLTYKVTLQDVYLMAPVPDSAHSLRPVRYQIANSLSASPIFLFLTHDAVLRAGFTLVDYSPPELRWGQPRADAAAGASLGLPLWRQDNESSIMYRNKETSESFTVVIGTSQKFRAVPQTFMAGVVDDMGSDTSAVEVLEDFLDDRNQSMTDLSTQVLVTRLSSGKQVVLSVNVIKEGAEASSQNFRLWVVVKEARK